MREGNSAEYSISAQERFHAGILTINFEESRPNGEYYEPVCYHDDHIITLEDFSVEPE